MSSKPTPKTDKLNYCLSDLHDAAAALAGAEHDVGGVGGGAAPEEGAVGEEGCVGHGPRGDGVSRSRTAAAEDARGRER